MKNCLLFTVLFICFLNAQSQNAFESTLPGAYTTSNAVTGWTVESGINGSPPYGCGGAINLQPTAGSNQFSIMATPIASTAITGGFSIDNVSIPGSPLGGNNVARLLDAASGVSVIRLKKSFTVTPANSLLNIAYCGSWDQQGHNCCDRPMMLVRMFDCSGNALNCYSLNLTPSTVMCPGNDAGNTTLGVSWTGWLVKTINLSSYTGTCLMLEISNNDCISGAHHGSAYVDVDFKNSYSPASITPLYYINTPVNFCAGSNIATLVAPLGYTSYSWTAPFGSPISPAQATLSTLTVTNPVYGNVYSVLMSSQTGCLFIANYTLSTTQVNAAGTGTTSSCQLGASGSASVLAMGSGSGYNYTWINAANAVVGTSSVASNLSPGTYTVSMNAINAPGCGTASTTVAIGVSAPNVYSITQLYCGGQATLNAPLGTSRQWYNGTASVSATSGGTASSFTVTSPGPGQFFWLSYLTPQGCRDSIKYVLSPQPVGAFAISSVGLCCPGAANAAASFSLVPALTATAGSNAFYVYSGATPPYTSAISLSSQNTFTALGLAAGNYSVMASDGVCNYKSTFTVTDYSYDYTVSPQNATVCAGSNYLLALNFGTTIYPGEYNYSVSPTTNITGTSENAANVFFHLSPSFNTAGIVSTSYSVTVTPAFINCPITKTVSVTAVNLPIPVISAIPDFCSNAASLSIVASPPGGSYSVSAGNWLSANGIITPSLVPVGTNTLVYSTSVGSCVTSATASFMTAQFNSAAITGQVNGLCVNGASLNLMSLVGSTVNGSWSGSGVQNNVFTPALAAGNYTLSYNTLSSNPPLCPGHSSLVVMLSNVPVLSLSGNTIICQNALTTLTAQGASTYSLNGSATGAAIILSPQLTTSYSLTGASNNCVNTKTLTIRVDACTGISEGEFSKLSISVYPNPFSENLFIDSPANTHIILVNDIGQTVLDTELLKGIRSLDLSAFTPGLYFLKVDHNSNSAVIRIVKTN